MSILVGDNFSYSAAKPLDGRLKYDTLANMKAVADATMYDGCLAYCSATDKTYQWKSTNTVDADTGKWREFSSGGGGGAGSDTTAYHTSDTAFTAIDDADYVPVYDTSASGAKKSLWSNIKSVLKTYFDTLYSTVSTRGTPTSDGTTLSLVNTGDMYNWNTDSVIYCTSSTSAATTAKVGTVQRGTFTLVAGAKVCIKFTYTNTASAPTLNISSSGAKNIKWINTSGTVATPVVWWKAGDIVNFIYDGTQWLMMPTRSMLTPTIILTATLAANASNVSFTNVPTSGNYLLTPFLSDMTRPFYKIEQSGSTVTVYYDASTSAATAYLKIEEV